MAKSITEVELLENKELREMNLERVEVLNKVGKIITLPNTEVLNIKLVADYYEVLEDTIKHVYQRNKEELTSNGATTLRSLELKEFKSQLQDATLLGRANAVTVFSTRAVMLMSFTYPKAMSP